MFAFGSLIMSNMASMVVELDDTPRPIVITYDGNIRIEVRSGASKRSVRVVFHNCTPRNIKLCWVDFNGSCQPYGLLEPDGRMSVYTFVDHVWHASDYGRPLYYLLNGVYSFVCPSPDEVRYQPGAEIVIYVRITRPLMALQELSAMTVSKSLRVRQDVLGLQLPVRLQRLVAECWQP